MGARFFRAGVRLLVVRGPVCDTVGYGVQCVLCLRWTASRQSHDPAGPRAGSGPPWADGSVGCGIVTFLCPVSIPWEVRRVEASTYFLEGRASACSLVDGAGSWSFSRQDRVLRQPWAQDVFRYNVC